MKTKHLFLLLLSLFTAMLVSAQTNYSRVRIKIPPGGLISLQAIRIALDHDELNNQDNSFTTSLSDKELAILQRNGITYQVLLPDKAAEFTGTNKPSEFYKNSIANATNAPTILQSSLNNPCGSFSSGINTPSALLAYKRKLYKQ